MRHLALLVVGLLSLPVHALTSVDLYRSEIVIDQEKNNGDAAARVSGMKEVIVRTSGDRDAVENEVVKKALRQHSQYLSQISYDQVGEQSSIRMTFSAPHIRGLLSQAQLPFWPESRSNLLVWLVEDSNFERNISWEHSSSQVLNRIKQEASVRGLPITIPVGDFDDVTGIAISDVWGGFVEPISSASQRYPSDAVLVVRAQGKNLRWTLYDQKPSSMMSRSKAPLTGRESGAQSAADMVNVISDYYANKDAVIVASESSEATLVEFALIDSALDFFLLESQLKSLSSVASLDILKIQGTTVTFKIHLLATKENFEQEVLRIKQVNKTSDMTPLVDVKEVVEVEEPITYIDETVDVQPITMSTETTVPTEPTQTGSDSTDPLLNQGELPIQQNQIMKFEWQEN